MVRVFGNIGERPMVKSYHSVTLLSVVSKIFQKHVINKLANHVFLISCSTAYLQTAVSDLIEFLRLFVGLGPLELYPLIYLRCLIGYDMLLFFRNSKLMGFQVVVLALFHHFSVLDSFRWFWM